jgi:hypothetical protein
MATSNDMPTAEDSLFTRHPYMIYVVESDVEYAGQQYDVAYGVLNMDTGILEFVCPSLAECAQFASHSAAAIQFFKQSEVLVPTPIEVSTGIFEEE